MRAVIQRVEKASVTVDGEVIGAVNRGYLILLGVRQGDTRKEAHTLADKITKLRVFEDEQEKMNLSIQDIGGEILCVSQFTICADIKKGNRPSFTPAAPPDLAAPLYEYFMECLKDNGVKTVEHGRFGADMQVSLVNDGPVTIWMDTDGFGKR